MLSKYTIDTSPHEVKSAHDDDTVFVIHALDGLSGRHARIAALDLVSQGGEASARGAALLYEYLRYGCSEVRNLVTMGDCHKAVDGRLPDSVIERIPVMPDVQQEIGEMVYRLSTPPREVGTDEGK